MFTESASHLQPRPVCDTTGMSDHLTVEQLERLDPERIDLRLSEHGWRLAHDHQGWRAHCWEDASRRRVSVLFDRAFPDYALRMNEVIDAIAQVEGRTKRAVYADLTGTVDPDQARAVLAAIARINARAEADILAGNPITGAHHRALEVERAAMEAVVS